MSEQSGKVGNTNASKRRQMAQEALRMKIDGEAAIESLKATREAAKTADKETIPALRLQADIDLALLKKVLPDLRHVELSSDDDSPLVVKMVRYGNTDT